MIFALQAKSGYPLSNKHCFDSAVKQYAHSIKYDFGS